MLANLIYFQVSHLSLSGWYWGIQEFGRNSNDNHDHDDKNNNSQHLQSPYSGSHTVLDILNILTHLILSTL